MFSGQSLGVICKFLCLKSRMSLAHYFAADGGGGGGGSGGGDSVDDVPIILGVEAFVGMSLPVSNDIDIFVNCNWVDTRWQYTLHINNT
jgi:hypothetical protein